MISRNAQKYCSEDLSLIENYELAKNDPTPNKWCIHHRDECKVLPSGIIVCRTMEELIENGRYYNCPANELIFLTQSEHWKLHHKMGSIDYDKVATSTKEAMKTVSKDKLTYWKGKKQTDEQKQKKIQKMHERRAAYLEYKANGGELKWNEFQKWNNGKKAELKDRKKHEFLSAKTRQFE